MKMAAVQGAPVQDVVMEDTPAAAAVEGDDNEGEEALPPLQEEDLDEGLEMKALDLERR